VHVQEKESLKPHRHAIFPLFVLKKNTKDNFPFKQNAVTNDNQYKEKENNQIPINTDKRKRRDTQCNSKAKR
jgi:hypothetical protein